MTARLLLGRLALSAFLLLATSSVTGRRDHHAPRDDSLPPDDGSGPDDEDMADLFGYGSQEDVIIRCYRCTGVQEQSGCNVTSFYENPDNYITKCNGHCINISSASSTVFDCTADVPAKSSACFKKGGMTMCLCATDLCNAFPPPPPRPTRPTRIPATRAPTPTPIRTPTPSTRAPPPSSSPGASPPVDDVTMELPVGRDEEIVLTDRDDVAGSSVNVTFPEPSQHRQNNSNYIQAGNVRSGAAGCAGYPRYCSLYYYYYYCCCLSFSLVFWLELRSVGEHVL